jgi:hypothetical protein
LGENDLANGDQVMTTHDTLESSSSSSLFDREFELLSPGCCCYNIVQAIGKVSSNGSITCAAISSSSSLQLRHR